MPSFEQAWRCVPENAHRIVTQDLHYRLFAKPRAKKGVGQKGQTSGVAKLGGRYDETVPIRAEGDGVLARNVYDVKDMTDDVVDPVATEKARAEDDADDAPLFGHGAKLLVVDVAPVRVGARDAGVRDDRGALCHATSVQKPAPVQVREVDDHGGRFAALDELLAPARQTFFVAPPAAVRGKAGLVRAEVQEPEVANAPPRVVIDPFEVPLERVGPLDPEKSAGRAVAVGPIDFFGRAHLAQTPLGAADLGVEQIDLLVDRSGVPPVGDRHRDQAEELRADAPFDEAGHVDMTKEGGARQDGVVAHGEVVADPAAPHERVGVQVDGGMSRMKSPGVGASVHVGERYHAGLARLVASISTEDAFLDIPDVTI